MKDIPYEELLFRAFNQPVSIESVSSVGGGNINETVIASTSKGYFFIKHNTFEDDTLFEKEEKGLNKLSETKTLKVPEVIFRDKIGNHNFLILERLEKGSPKPKFWENFGVQLARLHQNSQSKFGLDHDNHIGRLPQKNDLKTDWISFFIEHRLEVQLSLALDNGHIDQRFIQKFRNLYAHLPDLIPSEVPALIHGDLWGGNFMCGETGEACIFDPAIYFGHREMELSFTRLFGGFDSELYESYHDLFPLEAGFEERVDLYNLYPLLVHVNLFGTSYLSGIRSTLKRFA